MMLLSSRKIASQLASPAESLLPVMEGSVLRLLCSSGAVQSTAKLPAVRGKPSCSALTFCYRPENQLCHVPLHPSRLSLCPSQFYHRPKELIAKDLVRGSQSLVSYRDRTRGGCSTIVCTSEEVSSTSLCRFTPLDESGRDHTEAPSTRKLSSRRYHIQRSSGLETPGPGRHSEEDRAKQSFKKAGNVQLAYALQTLREELPLFFIGGHSFSMYTNDVRFENGLFRMRYMTRGVAWYRGQVTLFRYIWLFFNDQPRVNILSCNKIPERSEILVRWTAVGRPRLIPAYFNPPQRTLSGLSSFEVDGNGKFCRHRLDKVSTNHQRAAVLPKAALLFLSTLGLAARNSQGTKARA